MIKEPLTTENCLKNSNIKDKYQLAMYFIDSMYRNESLFNELFINQKNSYNHTYNQISQKVLSKYVLSHNLYEYINQKYYRILMFRKYNKNDNENNNHNPNIGPFRD